MLHWVLRKPTFTRWWNPLQTRKQNLILEAQFGPPCLVYDTTICPISIGLIKSRCKLMLLGHLNVSSWVRTTSWSITRSDAAMGSVTLYVCIWWRSFDWSVCFLQTSRSSARACLCWKIGASEACLGWCWALPARRTNNGDRLHHLCTGSRLFLYCVNFRHSSSDTATLRPNRIGNRNQMDHTTVSS